jgi:hypothetical protein
MVEKGCKSVLGGLIVFFLVKHLEGAPEELSGGKKRK